MKAVLVIDMPKDCWDCHLVDEWGNCNAIKMTSERYGVSVKQYDKERASWCPLRPLPQKKEVEVNEIEDLMRAEFTVEDFYNDKYVAKIRLATDKMIALGWNACLKEIEK